MPNIQEYAAKFTGDTSGFDAAAAKVEGGLGNLDKAAATNARSLGGVGEAIGGITTAAAVGGLVALAGGLAASVKTASDFEHSISGIVAVSGAGADEIDGLRQMALKLGADTSFSANEAAQGMEELIKAGVSMGDVMGGAARGALDLAAAGEVSVAEAATIASNAMNAFGKDGSEMAGVANTIAGAANASAIDVHEFGFSLSSVGAVAHLAGISFEDTATAIAVMGQAGIKGSDAGTSLKTMFQNLQPSTKAAVAEFERLGIVGVDYAKAVTMLTGELSKSAEGQKKLSELQKAGTATADNLWKAADKLGLQAVNGTESFERWAAVSGLVSNRLYDAAGNTKSLAEVSEILKESTMGLTAAEKQKTLQIMFGLDAIRAAAILTEAGAEGFEHMAEAMGKVSAQDVANERLNNLQGSLEKLKGSLETAAIVVGSVFLPTLKDFADQLTQMVNDSMPSMEQATLAVAQAFTDVMPVLGSFFKLIVDNGPTIATMVSLLAGFGILVTVTGWINAAVLAIQGLSLAFTTAAAAGGPIAGVVAILGGPLTLAIAAIIATIALLVVAWTQNWGDIQGKTQGAIDAIAGIIDTGLQAIQGFWGAHGAELIAAAERIWAAIQAAIDTALKVVQAAITLVLAAIQGDWTTVWESLKTIMQTAWDAYVAIVNTVGNLIVEAAKLIVQGIIEAFRPDGVLQQASDNLVAWLNSASAQLVETANTLGPGIVKGIVDSIIRVGPNPLVDAISGLLKAAIGDVIGRIGSFFPTGGGAGGMVTTSFRSGGGGSASGKQSQVGSLVQQMGGSLEDARVLMAITQTEGGLSGAVGDSGGSFGPFQFNINGQLQGFAKWLGVSLAEAKTLANDVQLSTEYAFQTYLGQTLAQGKALGLTGADLATYVQRYGQVSATPELTGANFNSMFGSGGSTADLTQQYRQQQGLPMYAAGGMVPGAQGAGQVAIVHGGEAVLNPEQIDKVNAALAREGTTLSALAGFTDTATVAQGKMATAMQTAGDVTDHLEQMQGRLTAIIGGQFPQATDMGAVALRGFGMASQGIVDELLAGNITLEQAQRLMVMYAAQTNLAQDPLMRMNAGLTTQQGALQAVLFAAAQVNPAYTETAMALQSGAISAEEASLNFLQLAASTKGATDASVPFDQALKTIGESMPIVNELMAGGKLGGDELTAALIGLSNSSGLVKSSLDLQSSSTEQLNGELVRIVDEMAIMDPRFAALNQKIKDGGVITDQTRGELVSLLGTISTTPAVVDPAITAHEALGTASTTMATDTTTAWQKILQQIATTVASIDATVKRLADAVIGYLNQIDDTEASVHVDTSSAVKNLDKATTAANKLKAALDKLDANTSKASKDAFEAAKGKGINTTTNVDPQYNAAGGWISAASGLNPVMTGELGRELAWLPDQTRVTPHWKTALIEDNLAYGRRGGGGDTITLIINGDVYDGDQFRERTIRALRDYRRQGGNV